MLSIGSSPDGYVRLIRKHSIWRASLEIHYFPCPFLRLLTLIKHLRYVLLISKLKRSCRMDFFFPTYPSVSTLHAYLAKGAPGIADIDCLAYQLESKRVCFTNCHKLLLLRCNATHRSDRKPAFPWKSYLLRILSAVSQTMECDGVGFAEKVSECLTPHYERRRGELHCD